MKKRLTLLGILICSIFCMLGCNNDPYKNMTLEYDGNSQVQLNIEEVTENGQTSYSYSTHSFNVMVKNVSDDVSKLISISGGQEFVDYSLTYLGNGITRVDVTPISYLKTGKFTMVIRSEEGNKSTSIDFQVDLKINNFTINSSNLNVIAKGQSIDLNAVNKYINFVPSATTQKNIEWTVVRPVGGIIQGHENNYNYDDENTDKYAVIENGVLKTFKNVVYPQMLESVVVGNGEETVYTNCVTLKATSKDSFVYGENGEVVSQKIPDRYVDIVVLEDCSDVILKMNCQKNESESDEGNYGNSFALEKNKDGEYDVTLLNPNYRSGMFYDTYYIERDLMFDFGALANKDDNSYNPSDYQVTTTLVGESDAKPIALSYSSLDNSFKVQAQKAGSYSHTFKVDNKNYPNIIDTEIVVNFHVIDIPTDIKINGTVVKDEYKIYKNYGNSWGTRFTVSLVNATNYSYFVFVEDKDFGSNLKMYKADGSEQIMAIRSIEGGKSVISSIKEDSGYSNFKSSETFYLRHNFETLPEENETIYIGVLFNVASSSYSEEVKNAYFDDGLLYFPVELSFETGLQSLDLSKNKYIIDLTDENYANDILDNTGIKLFDLPAGQDVDSVINLNDIVYDKSLITVYPYTDYSENTTSFYLKCNDTYQIGSTYLTITTKNGLSKTVSVETFIPTVYVINSELEEEYQMPLGMEFNEDEILYYFTGKDDGSPKDKFTLTKKVEGGYEDWGTFEYNSLQKLFMLKDTSMNIKFYDYLLTTDDSGEKVTTPIDITKDVKVTFNYPSYAVYDNGKLTVSRVTEDINHPLIMTLTYVGGYNFINEDGEEEYATYQMIHTVELYIYLPLQGVQVTTSKTVDIYVNESLGVFSKDLAEHTIISDFIPNEIKLGAQWNNNWFSASLPVSLWYDIDDVLASPIYSSNGSQLILYSRDGQKSRALVYGDLFQTTAVDNYTCPIECKINANGTNSLDSWIKFDSGYGQENYDWFVKNKIFSNNIVMVVNVYITQFSKLQNINSVKFSAKYAEKISNFDLNVADDGVYFEKRTGVEKLEASVSYSIDGTNAVNKDILLINSVNTVFTATVSANALGTAGSIKIVGDRAGIEYLKAVPEDNIKSINSDGTYNYYDESLVQVFRVKVADGSQNFPFEIKTIDKYVQMQEDVKSGNYYYYVLTANLNLSQLSNPQITFASLDNTVLDDYNQFSLDGAFSYYRNNTYYSSYNSLNNLYLKKTLNNLTRDVNIGLFENINQKVILKNLTLNNAKIEVTVNALSGHDVNIGLLSGTANSSKIYNCSVIGSIKIYNFSADSSKSNINIGGLVGGILGGTIINGLPNAYLDGYSNNPYNANVTIDYTTLINDTNGVDYSLKNHIFNVGGIAGLNDGDSNCRLDDLKVLPSINGINYNSNVGGVIGKTEAVIISKVIVYPLINISDKKEMPSNTLNISTFVGSGEDETADNKLVKIYNSKVYFVKEGYSTWLNNLAVKVNTASTLNFGGIIASLNNIRAEIPYTYIRSFHSEDLGDEYYANIYISAKNGANIAGLVGTVGTSAILNLTHSYFNADILTNGRLENSTDIITDSQIGLLVANVDGTGSQINNSYAIGRVTIEYTDHTTNYYSAKGLTNNIGIIASIANSAWTNGGTDAIPGVIIDADTLIKTANVSSILTIDNVYSVINENVYYFGESNKVIGLYKQDKYLLGTDGIFNYAESGCANVFRALNYSVLNDGDNLTVPTDKEWLWNSYANNVGAIAYPILLNDTKTKALYDLIPERILVDRVSSTAIGVYDVSYVDTSGAEPIEYPQLIVFVNKNNGGNYNNYFDIAINSEQSTISIKFDGQEIHTSFLEISSDLVISEDSYGTVLKVVGFKIYPVSQGVATITIASVLDKTVTLNIKVKVVEGITSINMTYDNDVELTGDYPTAYIDETTYLSLENVNKIGKISYDCNYSFGYQVEILDSVDNGKISINGREVGYTGDATKDIFILNTASLIVKGISIGKVTFKISPIVYLDGLEYATGVNYRVLDNISNEYTIMCCARAKDITISKDEIKIAPKNVTTFNVSVATSNVIIKNGDILDNYKISILKPLKINVKIGEKITKSFTLFDELQNQTVDNAVLLSDGSYYIGDLAYEINHELIIFKIQGLTISKVNYDSTNSLNSYQNTYKLSFDIKVSFDKTYYRQNANDFDLNTIEYNYVFIPDSNHQLSDSTRISISPNVVEEIFTNYYTRGELLVNAENEYYPSENESIFVIPGTNGLLKITLDEEFNDSSYITVTLDNKYKELVEISQMAGVVTGIQWGASTADMTDYIDSYKDIRFIQEINEDNYYGIKLSKMTLNYNDDNYFNKTYFVKLFLDRNYGDLQTVDLTITSYKVDNASVTKAKEKTVTYTVTQLPLIDVKVDNEYSAVLGVGIQKELEIKTRGISSDIRFSINPSSVSGVTIVDEDGNQAVNVLDINYILDGKKYYICADVEASLQSFKINFMAEEVIWGVRETTTTDLTIQLVDFEIEGIQVERVYDGVVTIKHGENLILNTNIEYKKLTVGSQDKIEDYEQELRNNGTGIVELIEYASAGVSIVDIDNNNYINYGELRLSYEKYINGEKRYMPLQLGGEYNSITIKSGTTTVDRKYRLDYYIISGTGITINDDTVKLELSIPYVYIDGKLTITNQVLGYKLLTIDFEVEVEDSSTYDRPNPIETRDDLIKACNAGGGDYILLNNLELNNWTPLDATFASLDGNGYTIKVTSFNLTSMRGSDTVNVGVFSTVSESTLIKNITVDVSNMLVTEQTLLDRIDKVANANINTYLYDASIDLAFVQEVNFGILTGTNYGSITNARIINTSMTGGADSTTKMYYHVVTSQGYIDGNMVTTNIGGIAGINSDTGAITNSYVGLSETTYSSTTNNSTIELVKNPSETIYNNTLDRLESVNIYPFTIAGGNNLAGVVAINNGTISNTYAKGTGLYNTYPAVDNSTTGGFVATNTGTITSANVESVKVGTNFRGIEDRFKIESTGNVGGFVYLNQGIIQNAYSNVYLETQSAFTGGFVFTNSENATISNAYTTTVNRNNSARGQFTGVGTNGSDVLNSGTYTNCYYLVLTGENINDLEHATAIDLTASTDGVSQKITWRGFSFTTKANSEGIWVLEENSTPKLASSTIATNSFRILTNTTEVTDGDRTYTVYTYEYNTYNLGSESNPLIISKATNFATYIIDNSININYNGKTEMAFGVIKSSTSNALSTLNTIRHVRLVNNLDFESIITSTKHKNTYLYKLIFAGVLDGNGMTLKNLNINSSENNAGAEENSTVELDNFGLFAQIGIDSDMTSQQTVIKNLNIKLRTYNSSGSRAGVLAGTIINSSIINVTIDGNSSDSNSIVVRGRNMAGALAGLVYADEGGTVLLHDINVKNIAIQASYGSLGVDIKDESKDNSKGLFNKFLVKNADNEDVEKSFVSLYDDSTNTTKLSNAGKVRTDVSYAGTIAGVILANNYTTELSKNNELQSDGTLKYRTTEDESSIDSITVSGNITIQTADNAGGLFGYVGEKTLIKNSKFELNSNQLIRASNFAGGIVGENHGIIEECYVALADSEQEEIDSAMVGTSNQNDNFIQLFDSLNSSTYTVAIGGIAGYSKNGVILDSYSKANVTKSRAYISGGLIGYVNGYNYMAFAYSTGAIYSKFITGGIVGLQVSTIDNTENKSSTLTGSSAKATVYTMNIDECLHMDSVYALTDWNVSTDDVDFRQENTKKLYDNQKVLYSKNDGSYYRFYVKMPEIGNLNTEQNNDYASLHNEYYIGSAIGYLMLVDATPSASADYRKFIDYTGEITIAELATLDRNVNCIANLDVSQNVVTNTLGLYASTGNLLAGNKADDYTTSTFSYYLDESNYTNMFSYRIAYNHENDRLSLSDSTYLNDYDLIAIDATKADNYYDVFTYPQAYNQEYLEQMIGSYYRIDTSNISTTNVFKYKYDESDRYTTNIPDYTVFVNLNNDTIWTLSTYLPKYSYALSASTKIIKNKDELNDVLTQVSLGKIYLIQPETANYTITLDIADTNKIIAFGQTIRDTFVGTIDDGKKPKIIINISGSSINPSNVNSLFNTLAGTSFTNIEFEINYKNVNFANEKLYSSYGLFANAMQNVTINNCSITLNIENDITIKNSETGTGKIFNADSVGLLFGDVNNCTISNSTFTINTKDITISDTKIENFGILAGYMSNTSLNNNKYIITTEDVTNAKSSESVNIAGLIGVMNHSTLNGGNDGEISITSGTITNNVQTSLMNISLISAYANNSVIKGVELSDTNSLRVNNTSIKANGQLNVSSIVAMSTATNIAGSNISGSITVTSAVDIDSVNVGSAIGYDIKSSKIDNVVSNVDENITVNSLAFAVGGIVGCAEYSANLINTAEYAGNLTIKNEKTGSTTTDQNGNVTKNTSKSYVGGIIGYAKGLVVLNNVFSIGKMTTSTVDSDLASLYVGGIIGYANSSEIDNFSVLATIAWGTGFAPSHVDLYVAGVIGYNNGVFTGVNGFVLFELPMGSNINKYAITNNSISQNTQNVFYCNELIGDYSADSNFNTFALADLYGSISEYSLLGKAMGTNSFFHGSNVKECQNLKVIIPNGSNWNLPADWGSNTLGSLYNPKVLSSSSDFHDGISGYNVILTGISMVNVNVNTNAVVSGRTLADGNVVVTVGNITGASGTQHVFNNNYGIISNLYFQTHNSGKVQQNVAVVNTNNGYILQVYAYGMTESQYAIANTNNGNILKSASATIYVGSEHTIYGLVYNNTNLGYIADCYSSNFGHTANVYTQTQVYGLARTNAGIIENSFYYIPSAMIYENVLQNIAFDNSGRTNRCVNSEMPSFISSRKTIWTTENNHAQIIGFKDIEGAIVLKLKMNNSTTIGGENITVEKVKTELGKSSNIGSTFDYEINFYSNETLPYNIVRFSNGTNFSNYINQLTYTNIPENTIILIDGEITISGEMKAFSIPSSSMIVGRKADSSITFGSEYIRHALIEYNKGVLACLEFNNLKMYNTGDTKYFAPIMHNYGVVYDIDLIGDATNEIVINGGNSRFVAGVVARNYLGAVINNCTENYINMNSIDYYNLICNESYGSVYNYHIENIACSGNPYRNGIGFGS